MGLYLSCGVKFSYGGFNKFRCMLAKEINIDLNDMKGFGGDKLFSTINDNIKYLLEHSDCDGYIEPKECGLIAPRLRELTKEWEYSIDEDIRWYREQAIYLAEGMEDCYKNNKPLFFE